MKLNYIIEKVSKSGQVETTTDVLSGNEIKIGRAATSDILLRGRSVSVAHARLVEENGSLILEDLNSLSGVRVNGQLVKRIALSAGDQIQIASYTFRVERKADNWTLIERYEEQVAKSDDERLEQVVRRLQYTYNLPSYFVVSSALVLFFVVFYFFFPLIGVNETSWTSGPLALAHAPFGHDCKVCHAKPFEPVRDSECLACHKLSDHSKNIGDLFESHAELNLRCATCHMEHNGNKGLLARDSKLCLNCHANTDKLLPDSDVLKITSYSLHPEFRVAADSTESGKEVALSASDVRDLSTVKLNHELHLEADLLGPDGPTQLNCLSCHEFSDDQTRIMPIKFEKHCQSCHGLGFDENYPQQQVPHAKPDVVYNFLVAEYAKSFLRGEGEQETVQNSIRRKPGNKVARKKSDTSFAKQSIVTAARDAETQLFTKTACYLCHEISELEQLDSDLSRFAVNEPNIVVKWFKGAIFDHGAHQAMACGTCHGKAAESKKTADILVPGVKVCMDCHTNTGEQGTVPTDCITCHSYHDSLVFDFSKKSKTWFSKSFHSVK